jgi:hypothetical protein
MNFPGRLHVVVAGTAVMAAGLVTVNNAAADDQMIAFGKETFQINLGYYRPNFTTSVSEGVPGSAVPPGNISGENDLGLDKHLGVGRLDGYWRFADKHRLFFGYYNLDRSTTATLNRDVGPIEIPALGVNDTILAGSNVRADSKWQVYILGYGYSFYKTDTVEVAGKFGLNVARIGTTLNGTLNTLNNGTLNGATAGDSSGFTAPLPVLALSGDWAINERWRLKGSLGGFKANVSDVKATVTDASVATEYRLFRNFGLGAGYSLLRVTGDVNKSNNTGSLDWKTGGLQLYASLVF